MNNSKNKNKAMLVLSLASAVTVVAVILTSIDPFTISADEVTYDLTLNSSNKITSGDPSTVQFGEGNAKTDSKAAEIEFHYSGLYNTDGVFATFRNSSTLENWDIIHGLKSITVSSTTEGWSFAVYYSYDTTFPSTRQALLNATNPSFDFDNKCPNYFKIQCNSADGAEVSSIGLNYNCAGLIKSVSATSENDSKGSVSGSGLFAAGDSVTVTATPNTWYNFSGWYNGEDLVSEENPYTFSMPGEDVSLLAKFERPLFNVGDVIDYGTYPQSKVTDEELIATLNSKAGDLPSDGDDKKWISYDYYVSSSNAYDFMWYQDITEGENKYRGVYFDKYRPNNTKSGHGSNEQESKGYVAGTTYWFEYSPIKWRVLSDQEGSTLILSQSNIDSQQFFHLSGVYTKRNRTSYDGKEGVNIYDCNYEFSDLRGWLNVDFYNSAFSVTEKSDIKITEVDNGTNHSGSGNLTCDNTFDKVFAPSLLEVNNTSYGLGTAASRKSTPTEYAVCQGSSTGSYKLRSAGPSSKSGNSMAVSTTGSTSNYSVANVYGIRPAITLDLD